MESSCLRARLAVENTTSPGIERGRVASGASSARAFVTSGSFSRQDENGGQGQTQSNSSNRENGNGDGNGNGNGNGNGDDEEDDDPDDDQYEDDITICHRQDGDRGTRRLSASAAARHLENHRRDRLGPCPRRNGDD